jgi:competence protein ComEC
MNKLSCWRMQKRKLVIAMLGILACSICFNFCTRESKSNNNNNNNNKIVSVHFLDIGKADSILIKIDDKAVLIDAGTIENAKDIINYLKKQDVTKLDYAVATHCDKDHVGGMSDILRKFQTDVLVMSSRGKNTKPYQSMMETAVKLKVTRFIPKVKTVFYVGNVKFSVLAPGDEAMAAGTDNESSIVLMMQYGETKFLFMGDAMEVSENEMLQKGYDLQADVIKVGHHGSKRCSSEKFLYTVNPAVAVITCDEGDGTSLPEKETLEVISEQHILLYRTDKDGTIVMTTDGVDIKIEKNQSGPSPS